MVSRRFQKLQDKHVLIFGGTSGIGYAVAEAALQDGAHITISSSSSSRATAAAASLKELFPDRNILAFAADLSTSDFENVLDNIFRTACDSPSGKVNHVVFTAADKLNLGQLDAVTPVGILKAAQMRMVVPIIFGKVAGRYLDKSPTSSIVLTGGVVSEKPAKGWSTVAYFAGGLQSLAKGLAVDLAPIRVNLVRPGYVDTGLWSPMPDDAKSEMFKALAAGSTIGRIGQAEDVAEAYMWLLKDGNTSGSIAGTDSGLLLL